jgi:uncharacterized membrane protein (DUF4010 family)
MDNLGTPPNPGVCSICHRAAAVYGHDRATHIRTQVVYLVTFALPVLAMAGLLVAATFGARL